MVRKGERGGARAGGEGGKEGPCRLLFPGMDKWLVTESVGREN